MLSRNFITAAFAAASLPFAVFPAWAQESVVLDQEAPQAEPAQAQPQQQRMPNVLELRQQANAAYKAGDAATYYQAATLLNRMRPYNDEYMAMVVVGAALQGDRSAAYEMMLRMQQQGLAQDFDATDDTESIRGTQAYSYVNDLLKRASEPAGNAEPLFTLPEDVLLPTSIAWDASRERYLVGDAREGAILSVDEDGQAETLVAATAENGLQGIYSLLVDEDANRLWVTSNPTQVFAGFDPEKAGPAELIEFSLDDMAVVGRYPVPADGKPHRLGDMIRTPAGDIYIADGVLPLIYRLVAGESQLQPFVAAGGMISLRGFALSDDGRHAYLADYEMGIMGFDLVEKKAFRVKAPATLNLGGIEGLFFWNDHLVIIQNGISPQRIMRLKLNDTGDEIKEVAPLAVALEMFNKPDFGTMIGDELVFFANSHWMPNALEHGPVRVARLNVQDAPSLVAPDIEKFWEDYRKQQQDGS
mgnify:CR=1 FL=1